MNMYDIILTPLPARDYRNNTICSVLIIYRKRIINRNQTINEIYNG